MPTEPGFYVVTFEGESYWAIVLVYDASPYFNRLIMYESAVIKPSEYHTAAYTLIDTSTPLIENPTDTGFYLVSNAAETEWGVVILSGTSPFLRVVTKKRVRLNTIYTGNVENYINLSQNYPEEPDITSYNWYTVTIP